MLEEGDCLLVSAMHYYQLSGSLNPMVATVQFGVHSAILGTVYSALREDLL